MPTAMPRFPEQVRVPIGDSTGVSEARRQAAAVARALGFDETAAGRLALGLTEVATNIIKHARTGEILVRALGEDSVEVIAVDGGPGISDLAESFRDGYSTAGSPGTGLGSLSRTTVGLDVHSVPGGGTIVRFEIPREARAPARSAPFGVVCVPKDGEQVCGDCWAVAEDDDRRVLFVADGLGHGPEAARAARTAVEAARTHARRPPAEILKVVDAVLRTTRGAAGCVALLDPAREMCTFCGVGNISASIHHGGKSRSMVSHGGILGMSMARYQEFTYPLPRGALVILHSDGVATRWALEAVPGLANRHPSVVAAALYRDHSRRRDDATVLAARAG